MKAAVVSSLLGLAAAGAVEYNSYTTTQAAYTTANAYDTAPAYSTEAAYSTSCEESSYAETTGYAYSSTYEQDTTSYYVSYSSSEECDYSTEVVDSYTTYCPEATVISHGTWTYSVTAPGTVTVTNCPCTLTHPVYSTVAPPVSTAPAPAPVAPTSYSAAPAPAATTPAAIAQGGASSLTASGAGLAGIVAIVAFLF